MLQRLRRGLTYANVMSTAAVFTALGGVSYAAIKLPANSVGSKQLRKRSVTPSKIHPATRAFLRGAPGQLGPVGPVGPKGDPGPQGPAGATGSALLTGVATGLPPAVGGIRRAPVNGASLASPDPTGVASLSPNRQIVAGDLAGRVSNDVPAGGSVQIAFVANPTGAFTDPAAGQVQLACTIGPAERTCTAPGPVTIPPASAIFMRLTIQTGTNPGNAYWGITIEPPQT